MVTPSHRSGIATTVTVLIALLAALAIGACGGSKSQTKTTSSSTSTAAAVAVSGHAADANVAVVNGTPITFGTYEHWMIAAETSNATEEKQSYTITPLWPPDYSDCVTNVRQDVPAYENKTTATIQKDCKALFTELNTDTLDFLIQGIWLPTYGNAHGVTVSQAQINSTFAAEKKTSFKTPSAYQTFLKENGETEADLMFRIKVDLYYKALVAKALGTQKASSKTEQAAEEKVIADAQKAYKAKTACATGYATSYCAS